ncbi:polysaccharide deacetylase family protein [Planctomicrobium piriforme]|uniref:Polysaccharide deacetylase n=1 Tax=Planctomicrobium piriforme TaxID=1576369 RepID=A0A1I3FA07_9PLAN|nr:polysaccharide deacetylase family protein [Planctomicrobium piriforme]SFI08044.1 Polysaccharide deacetylase [Planctomicrobium piriforme]
MVATCEETSRGQGMSKREILASTLERSGLGALLSSTVGRWQGLLVFNYHRVGDGSKTLFDRGIYSATQAEFDRQVAFLKKQFDIVRISDLEEVLHRRGRAILLTFDDGYRDNYDFAFPVLSRHQTSATFFLTSGFLDGGPLAWWDEIAWMVHSSRESWLFPHHDLPELLSLATADEREAAIVRLLHVYKSLPAERTTIFLDRLGERTGTGRCPPELARHLWMTWDMAREMDRCGMDIGGHTVSHPVLAHSSLSAQREEIFTSKQRIELQLGHPITSFSYPVGQPDSFTEATQALLHEAGYRWAFSFSGGFSSPGKVNQLNVPRVPVAPHISHELFQSTARLPWLFA